MSDTLSDAEVAARWQAWALAATGGDDTRARAATEAAMDAIARGWDPLSAAQGVLAQAGRNVAATGLDPGFYRPPALTALLALGGGTVYLLWWTFQLLSLARRKGFAGSRNPWWILAPFYNLVLISRAFKGLHEAAKSRSLVPLSPALANGLYLLTIVTGNLAGRLTATVPALLCDAFSLALGAGTIWLVQRHANAVERAERPDLPLRANPTWGMILALAVGILFEGSLVLVILVGPLIPQ